MHSKPVSYADLNANRAGVRSALCIKRRMQSMHLKLKSKSWVTMPSSTNSHLLFFKERYTSDKSYTFLHERGLCKQLRLLYSTLSVLNKHAHVNPHSFPSYYYHCYNIASLPSVVLYIAEYWDKTL